MSIANLEIHPERPWYDALSYEWGSPDCQREITVQGKPCMIRENLWNALHQLRSIKLYDPIWIDAICINQEDLEERNAQVNIMHIIYGSAKVYGGRFPRPVGPRKIASTRESLNLYNFFDTASEDEEGCTVSVLQQRWQKLLSTHDDEWLALACLLNRTYWSRIWIVQEYVLAQQKTIYYGRHIIDIEKLEVVIAHILRLDLGRHPDINPRIQDSISRIQTSPGALIVKYATPWLSERRSILELLVACKNSEASEPRDKIYAIVGLAWDIWLFDHNKIDYAKSISEIKFDVIRSYLSLNWSADSQKKAAKLWFMLNEILPETLETPIKNEQEAAQSIISEVITIPPRIQHLQSVFKQVDAIFEPWQELPQSQRELEAVEKLSTKSTNYFSLEMMRRQDRPWNVAWVV